MAVGPYTNRMPGRPTLPSGASEQYLIGFPDQPTRTSVVNWILLNNDKEIGWVIISRSAVIGCIALGIAIGEAQC